MPTSVLDRRRQSLAEELDGITREAGELLARDDFNPDDPSYVALREQRDKVQAQLADAIAMLDARNLAHTAPPQQVVDGRALSEMGLILREYDRGHSPRFDIAYHAQRETTTDQSFPSTSRIQVASPPIITPTLDVIGTVQTGNLYDFVVPPPVVAASTVTEGAKKPTVPFLPTRVNGELDTDALIVDVTRQYVEDTPNAESQLRSWLTNGVRKQQDAKAAAAVAAATGTLTASSTTMLNAVRLGKAELSKIGVVATSVHMNPDDAANADIAATEASHDGPVGYSTVWGMRVIENPGITVGTAIVGDLAQAVYLLYRSSISTYITDSGATDEATPRDRFQHNLLGFLGEGRSKAAVVYPGLLVKCTVSP